MTTNRSLWTRTFRLGVALALFIAAGAVQAADVDDVTASTQRARNGGGLKISSWQPDEPAGQSHQGSLAFQGYFEKGLDLHLAWENTLGYWNRKSTWTESPPLGADITHEVQTHLVPTLTALRLYPFTTPADRVEPYLSAGAGVVLGFQQEKLSGGVVSSGPAASMHTGLGVRAGAGVDLHASSAFGLSFGGHFGSASFGEDMPGQKLFQGWGADLGLTYRFQYR